MESNPYDKNKRRIDATMKTRITALPLLLALLLTEILAEPNYKQLVLVENKKYCVGLWGDSLGLVLCEEGDHDQQWYFKDKLWHLRTEGDGECVDVNNVEPRSDLFLHDCDDAKNKFWHYWQFDGERGYHEIENDEKDSSNDAMCITFEGNLEQGADIELRKCNKQKEQAFFLIDPEDDEPVEPAAEMEGPYLVILKEDERFCMGYSYNDADLVLAECDPKAKTQHWLFSGEVFGYKGGIWQLEGNDECVVADRVERGEDLDLKKCRDANSAEKIWRFDRKGNDDITLKANDDYCVSYESDDDIALLWCKGQDAKKFAWRLEDPDKYIPPKNCEKECFKTSFQKYSYCYDNKNHCKSLGWKNYQKESLNFLEDCLNKCDKSFGYLNSKEEQCADFAFQKYNGCTHAKKKFCEQYEWCNCMEDTLEWLYDDCL